MAMLKDGQREFITLSNVKRKVSLNYLSFLALFLFTVFSILQAQPGMSANGVKVVKPYAKGGHHKHQLKKLQLIQNKSETVRISEPYATALISNEAIADIVPLSDQLIYVLGKKIGTTRLTVLDSKKNITGIIEIEVTYDLRNIERELKRLLPKTNISVRSLNGNVLLSGSVPDAVSLKKAITFAEKFTNDSKVTNAMRVADPQQVMLEVRFIEANKEAAKEIGIGWNVIANKFVGATLLASPTSTFSSLEKVASGLVSGNTPFGTGIAQLANGGTSVEVLIQALENKNVARRLAEPNLVALSGDTANFLAGGEFPFAVVGANETVGTQFRKFGISLQFTPTVLDNGLINLKIEPEVSEIGSSLIELGNGAKAPTLLVRKVKTTVELRDGQSFAIAGLLQSTNSKIRNQLPWIGNVPILGALFRSAAYQKRETDLVIIITPRLVQPATPTQKLRTPLDDTMASNDVEFFLGGKDSIPIKNRMQQNKVGHIIGRKPNNQTWETSYSSAESNDNGNAVKTNKAIQTIDPWPRNARDAEFETDGVRSLRTIEKFYDGSSGENNSSSGDQKNNQKQPSVDELTGQQ